ncbi:MAG: diguanylate cyclase, partial [Usitatibacter sp.]
MKPTLGSLDSVLTVLQLEGKTQPEQLELAGQLIEALPVPVFFKARDGTYLGVNQAWEEFFGVGRRAIIGSKVASLYSETPEIAARHLAMDEALWTNPGSQHYEIALTAGGQLRHAMYYKATFQDAAGETAGLVGTIIDVTDRKRGEQREAIEHAVARFLGDANAPNEAIPGIIRVVCERLGWVCGARWSFDESSNEMICVDTWSVPDEMLKAFQAHAGRQTFVPGNAGLIRAVIATGESRWIEDVTAEPRFLRKPLAEAAGLKGAFAMPILVADRVVGAIEFFARERRKPDPWMLQTAMGIGRQIGQLMARRQAEAAMRESEARFRSLIELSSDWYWEQDAELRFTTLSRGIEDALHRPLQDFIGKPRWDIDLLDVSPQEVEAHKQLLIRHEPFRDFEYGLRDASGQIRYISASGEPILDEQGIFRGYRGVAKDMTKRRMYEAALRDAHAELERQANHDALTGLPNRYLLNDRLGHAVSAQRERRSVAVVFIDLDRFKVINDSLGHDVGDEVLRHVAGRLKAAVREGDTVARLGGDEFVLILDDQSRDDLIYRTMQRIVERVNEPILVGRHELDVSCSAGIALYPGDGDDAATLLKNADIAMYRAKLQGRNAYQFFTAEMNEVADERLAMEQSLRRALEHDELVLHYQPRVHLRSGAVNTIEALVRWNHPQLGLIPPDRFIPLAEEAGLIVPIGEWVLRKACEQGAEWRRAGMATPTIAVNLSARQLWGGELTGLVARVLDETGMAGKLELELTESMILDDTDRV